MSKLETINIMLDENAMLPVRAHWDDAGLDLRTPESFILRGTDWGDGEIHSAAIDTGVHIQIPPGYFGKLESKSGLHVKHDIVALGGVIDSGFSGTIVVKLYNLGTKDYTFRRGDKLVQLVIQPCETPELKIVEQFDDTERGDGGFGSSGR